MPWLLKYYDAGKTLRTVTFPQLAALEGGKVISDAWVARFMSHKASSVMLRLPGVPPSVAPAIPFESRIQIVDPTGTIQFQGLRTDRKGTADPRRPSSSYQFDDEWYFLDHCPFYQTWVRSAGNLPFTNIVLFQPNPGQVYLPAPVQDTITTGQQITDILNWAILMGANLQIGEIDPDIYEPWYPIQSLKCGDAIRHCLKLHPDCFTEIDYSTTPPTFHVRQRSNLIAVTLPYAFTDASGRRHTATDIQPRPELQPTRVGLFFRVMSNEGVISTPMDIYPNSNLSVQGPVIAGQIVGGAAAPYTVGGTPIKGTAMANINSATAAVIQVGAPPGLRALDFAMDLQGPRISEVSSEITTTAFDPTNKAWWRKKVPSLRQLSQGGNIPNDGGTGAIAFLSTTINGGGATDITVQDDSGNPINVSGGNYAFELLPDSAPMAWMNASVGGSLEVIEATVTAHFSYTRQKSVGSGTLNMSVPNDHVHHVRVKLTNSASVSATFSQPTSTGEAIPTGLAQSVYASLATLQYSFTHTIVEKPFNGWLKPGKHAINLGGSEAAPEWAAMNATLQQSEYKMHLDGAGNTFDNFTIQCGPVDHLEPGQLVQLFNVFANRDLTKLDPNERLSGTTGSGTVAMPSDTAQENSVPGSIDNGLQVFSAPDVQGNGVTNAITHDPANGQTKLSQLNSTTGAVLITGIGMVELSGAGAPGPSTLA